MGDSWRFDPYKDYTNDDSEDTNNFRRFKKSKHRSRSRDNDFEKPFDRSRGKKSRPSSKNWR